MSKSLEIDAGYILLGIAADDAEDAIEQLCAPLHHRGAVRASYAEETIEREHKHPTGLPTRPFPIAFPHAEAEGVHRSALAVATLNQPVDFRNMADPDEDLPVEIIFLLANREPEEQVQALRQLALIFGESEKLVALREMQDAEAAAKWLISEILAVE
ncbi:MAG: PTS sugar transporter subunit IIA [Anaerolineales bacterium]